MYVEVPRGCRDQREGLGEVKRRVAIDARVTGHNDDKGATGTRGEIHGRSRVL